MRNRDRTTLGDYFRSMADELGLRDWTLNLLHEPCSDDCNAQVRVIYGRKVADIKVSEEFRGFDLERARRTVVHELIHLHFAASTNQVENDLSGHLSAQAMDLFYSAWLRDFEYGIDGLATSIALSLPLIEWPQGKQRAE